MSLICNTQGNKKLNLERRAKKENDFKTEAQEEKGNTSK